MRFRLLILLPLICLCPNPGLAGELVGDWYQEEVNDSSIIEKQALSQPTSQSNPDIQSTLGIRSPGLIDPVEFFLIISSNVAAAACLYSVTEIIIDSRSYSARSTTHSSDISQITTSDTEQQKQLWRDFRRGQNLQLKVRQDCTAQNSPNEESLTFDFALNGSSAAYRFVAGLEAVENKPKKNIINRETESTYQPEGPIIITIEATDQSILPALLIVATLIALAVMLLKWLAKPASIDSAYDPANERIIPDLGSVEASNRAQDRREIEKATSAAPTAPVAKQSPVDDIEKDISQLPRYKVEHVIDGDTVIVSTFLHKYKVRLDSIDCPEDGQEWGDIATAGLIKLIGGRHVRLEEHGIDDYERTLATIYVRDRKTSGWANVNERMVTLGHAWVMRRYYNHLPKQRQDQLNRLERWAKSKRVGLWNTPNPIPPWNWRQSK